MKRLLLVLVMLSGSMFGQMQDIPGSEAVGASRQKIVDNFNFLNAGKASLSMGAALPATCAFSAVGPVVLFVNTADDTLYACEPNGWHQVAVPRGSSGPGAWGSIIGNLTDQADLVAALAGKAAVTHTHAAGDIASGVFPMTRLASSGMCDSTSVLWGDGRCAPPTAAEVGAVPLADKGTINGVASLDGGGKVPIAEIPTGQTGSTVAAGNDARLSDSRTPTAHASTHGAGQADALSLDAGQMASGVLSAARLPDLSATYAKVADKTGVGAKIASAASVPSDGCATWSSGNISSTGQPCGSGSGGEANTASNQGAAGVGLFYQKSGVDLQFYKLNPASNKVTITLDGTNHKIDFDVATANLGLTSASVGLGNVPNVDATNATNISSGTLAASRVGDLSATYQAAAGKGSAGGYASLDGGAKVPITQLPTGSSGTAVAIGNDARFSDARVPTAHAATHRNGGSDEIATAAAAANAIPKAGASGTLASGWLPTPGAISLGGVQSKAVVSHYFLTGISSADGSVSAATIGPSDLPVMTGDSGAGGVQGAVPPPAAGDSAKFLTGAGTWSNVNKVSGTSIAVNSSADQVLGTNASATGVWMSVPSCGDSSHALAYSTATHSYSCQSITGSAGGGTGQLQYNNSGVLGGFTVSGDGTLNPSTGSLTVTKTNGVNFASSATVDTTNAANLSSGTLPSGRLPQFSGGDVTSAATGSANLTISAGRVTDAMLAGSISTAKLASKSGNGGTIATTSGSLTAGNYVKIDVNGNLVDSGSSGGSGGGNVSTSGTPSANVFPIFTSATAIGNGNLSQDISTGELIASKSLAEPAPAPMAFSATPTFDLSTCSRCEMAAMTANVTTLTFTNAKPGLKFSLTFLQDAAGSRTVSGYTLAGGSVTNTCVVSPTPNVRTTQQYEVASDGTTIRGIGCSSDDAGSSWQGVERAAMGTPTSGAFACWPDSTNHVLSCKFNNSGTVSSMVTPDPGTAHQFITGLSTTGTLTKTGIASGDLPSQSITRTKVFTLFDFTDASDSGKLEFEEGAAIHLTRAYCSVIGAANIVINLDKRTEGTPNTDSGAHLLGSDLTCTPSGANIATFANASGQCGGTSSCAVPGRTPVALTVTSQSGGVTGDAARVIVEYTID